MVRKIFKKIYQLFISAKSFHLMFKDCEMSQLFESQTMILFTFFTHHYSTLICISFFVARQHDGGLSAWSLLPDRELLSILATGWNFLLEFFIEIHISQLYPIQNMKSWLLLNNCLACSFLDFPLFQFVKINLNSNSVSHVLGACTHFVLSGNFIFFLIQVISATIESNL